MSFLANMKVEGDGAYFKKDLTMPSSITRGAMTMPTDSAERKRIPLVTGVLDYFPAALAEVAKLSKIGNDKHNPGQPLHHARGKSNDHADCIGRHMVDRFEIDPDTGMLHMVEVCWRSLALLQEMLEARGAPLPLGAKLPDPPEPKPDLFEYDKMFRDAYADLLKEMDNDSSRESNPSAKRRGKSRGKGRAGDKRRGRKARQ